jgi:hypothetical protein
VGEVAAAAVVAAAAAAADGGSSARRWGNSHVLHHRWERLWLAELAAARGDASRRNRAPHACILQCMLTVRGAGAQLLRDVAGQCFGFRNDNAQRLNPS